MTRTLIAAFAAALAAPALVNDQLALSLGLEPGVFTTAELAILRGAAEQNDELRYRTTLERGLARHSPEVLSTQGALRDLNPSVAFAERAATSLGNGEGAN